MENKYGITIGSDPEVMLCNKEGVTVSGIGKLPGTKHDPHPISDEGHCVQIDNVNWEFNIPPSKTEEEFVGNIQFVMDYLDVQAKAHGIELSTKSSDSLNPKELTHPIAQTFGCDPDYNVYLKDMNPAPEAADKNLRCAGGHIHIGYPNPNVETTEKIVKAFDMFVVLPALLIDTDERRRELYGKAGAFRFKDPWGLECRALSNFWIHDEAHTKWVYNQTILAVNTVLDNKIDELIEKYSDKVVEAINSNNKDLARELVAEILKKETV